jgi:hypothetical protein
LPKREIPLGEVKPYLEEIVLRSGSQRKAARELGVARTQLRIWLQEQRRYRNGKKYTYAQFVTRESAALILRTLRRLRVERKFYDHHDNQAPNLCGFG